MHRTVFMSLLFAVPFIVDYAAGVSKQYDYIVVGGGTAGCVIAARLSENPAVTVLLLEAGPLDTDDVFTRVPRTYASVIRSGSNWVYTAEPQAHMEGQTFGYKVGKMLGGGSSHNGMTLGRASKHDFDTWEEMGNPGWGYEDVLPYYKKYENVYGEGLEENTYRGVGGPVSIRRGPIYNMTDLFIRSAAEDHLQWPVTDYFGPQDQPGVIAGFGYSQINTDARGVRSSTAEAYIRPIMGRWNLEIMTGALVTKLDIKNHIAEGVSYEKDGVSYEVKVKHDIVLCAGSFASAQLLMLSGIGPKDDLENLGIDVIKDLPVGKKLLDRFLVKVPFTNVGSVISGTTITFDELFKYVFTGNGTWTSIGQIALGLFRPTSQPQDNNSSFIMISFRQNMPSLPKALSDSINNGENYEESEVYKQFKQAGDGPEGFTMWIFHTGARATGEVKLKTTDINDLPEVTHHFLQNDTDYADVIEGVRLIQDLVGTDVFHDRGVNITHIPIAHCAEHDYDSDEYWRCYIKNKGEAGTQQFSTIPMGPAADADACVDNELRVKGINRLRVADASIIPMHFAGNPMLQVIMIGEKAADIIKAGFGLTN